jgi:hypothetical protein
MKVITGLAGRKRDEESCWHRWLERHKQGLRLHLRNTLIGMNNNIWILVDGYFT